MQVILSICLLRICSAFVSALFQYNIECSGIHRSLGTHISKVRSFTLDTTSYTRDLFDLIRAVGNEASNKIWEANLIQSEHQNDSGSAKVVFRRPLVNDPRDYKVSFIQKKYVDRAFVDRKRYYGDAETPVEQSALITKALFNEVTANSILGVIATFAAGADLNAIQEVDQESEGRALGTVHAATESDDTTGSPPLNDSPLQAKLEGLSMGSETSSRYSRSTIASSVLNVPGSALGTCQEGPSIQPLSLDARPPSQTDRSGSSFMVMQTSPLLLALRNGVPFSLDDLFEVYPMAEFMLQNGAASNLSVEVRMVDDDAEASGQVSSTGDGSVTEETGTSTPNTGTSHVESSGSINNSSGWDSAVDPEDIKHFQQRSNRRSLGQVVHMRGEGGSTAMEYLRSKSAARGEPMPGSPPINGDSSANATFGSPPDSGTSLTLSPRLRPQGPGSAAGSVSAPTSVVSSPSAAASYPTNVHRQQQSSSMQQDLSTLFVKRRESDGGLGTALFAASKATAESSEKSASSNSKTAAPGTQKSGGDYTLQNAANISTSPTNQSQHGDSSSSAAATNRHHHQSSSSSSSVHGLYALSHSLSTSGSRAHKVKAQLSKSLRLSAAYIKNNMMKDDKENTAVPTITHTVASPPSAARPGMMSPKISSGVVSELVSDPIEILPPSTSATSNADADSDQDQPLSGPYVFLLKKGSLPPTLAATTEGSETPAAAAATTTTVTATTTTTASATPVNTTTTLPTTVTPSDTPSP